MEWFEFVVKNVCVIDLLLEDVEMGLLISDG